MADDVQLRRLEVLRGSIDNLDAALVHLLAERFRCTEEVGQLKAEAGLAAADPAREAYQIARLRALAEESGLNPAFAEKVLGLIISEVIQHHLSAAERLPRSQQLPARR
jgi:chorismate mutase